ncbi:MAG: DNA repair protein [Lachnospiraceae bacterium]|nr:DNA repair protein [Lachnospiraceae bacterium]
MTKKIKIMTASYKNIHLTASDARKVRGFFADLDDADSNLHNHTEDGTDIYRYPKIQYKVLNQKPVIVAAEEGIRSLHPHLMEQTEIKIGDKVFTDTELDINLSERPIGDSRDKKTYRFLTPWLALNQKNYAVYQKASTEEKEQMLTHILIGNLLSLCKGFGVTIERSLEAELHLKSTTVLYKGKKMEGFKGTFQVNCCIPELLGIGKATARGFGTVKLEKNEEVCQDES